MLKFVFILTIILSSVAFTPYAFGQDLKKATWLETATVVYDQKLSKSVTATITLQSINNNEIQIPDDLMKKILSHKEIVFVSISNEGECVMGVSDDKQCIMINFDLVALKKDGGINVVHTDGKSISDDLISDLNKTFGTHAKFHSVWIDSSSGKESFESTMPGHGGGMVTVAYTMPKYESNVMFQHLTNSLISHEIKSAGGFYDVAEKLADKSESIVSVTIVQDQKMPLMMLTVSHNYSGLDDISQINPLHFFDIDELQRTEYFKDLFVPLNSIIQVVIFPETPSKIEAVNIKKIQELTTVQDVSEKGWFFVSTSYDKIDARFLFGGEKNVSADELIMKVKPEISSNEQFSVEDIRIGDQNDEGQNDEGQYAILAIIIIAAIGAAIFYLKGYKPSH